MGGNPGRWNYTNPDPPYRIANGVEAWAIALKGDWIGRKMPTSAEIEDYDLVIANLNPANIPSYLQLIRRKPAKQRWVALIEGCGFDYLDASPPLRELMNLCNLVANINLHTTAYLQHLTTTPVEWIGIPYPIQQVKEFETSPDLHRNEVLICPRQQRTPSFLVAEALGVPVRAYFQKVSRTPKNLKLYLEEGYFGKDLRVKRWLEEKNSTLKIGELERDMPTFWRDGGGCKLWVNLDPRYTWGRFVLDAAALGVPIISTKSTAHASILFPETTVDNAFCIDEAIDIGKRLLSDEAFRLKVIQTSQAGLQEFSPESCVNRLLKALEKETESET